jgi:hypothetical protein
VRGSDEQEGNLLVLRVDVLYPILDEPSVALLYEIPDVHPNLLGE